MGKMGLKTGMVIVMVAALVGLGALAAAQDKTADNMQILRDKVKADKKLLVASNMELTESEAKAFWPVMTSIRRTWGDQRAPGQDDQELCRCLQCQIDDRRGGQETHR